jgi:hypothetical protein
MSTRKQRHMEAELRRSELRLRWNKIFKDNISGGRHQIIKAISFDAESLAKKEPSRKSEIELALREFVTNLNEAIATVRKQLE